MLGPWVVAAISRRNGSRARRREISNDRNRNHKSPVLAASAGALLLGLAVALTLQVSSRLLHARDLIENGMNYLHAAFECGYESSSGFRDAFAREFGIPPGRCHVS